MGTLSCCLRRSNQFLFGESQQECSWPGRTANDDAVLLNLLQQLIYNLTSIFQSNLGTFDSNTKRCYNRFINRLAMLVARQLGMPCNLYPCRSSSQNEICNKNQLRGVCLIYSKHCECSTVRNRQARELSIPGSVAYIDYCPSKLPSSISSKVYEVLQSRLYEDFITSLKCFCQ